MTLDISSEIEHLNRVYLQPRTTGNVWEIWLPLERFYCISEKEILFRLLYRIHANFFLSKNLAH